MKILSEDEWKNRILELASKRYELLSSKYQKDGRNAAMFRDNVMDIIEELADAINVAELLFERSESSGDVMIRIFGILQEFGDAMDNLLSVIYKLDNTLPSDFRKETIGRAVQRREVGIQKEDEEQYTWMKR